MKEIHKYKVVLAREVYVIASSEEEAEDIAYNDYADGNHYILDGKTSKVY